MSIQTLGDLLTNGAAQHPAAPALLGANRPAMSYRQLADQTQCLGAQLRAMGIGTQDRLAIVLPNGPEMAAAFLAVAASAVAAPLNPAYRQGEFDFYLSDLHAKALLTVDGLETTAIAAAKARGLPIIYVAVDSKAPAGSLKLPGPATSVGNRPGPGDTALILHTSGTTSRPKIVPLTQANLCASAHYIQSWLELRPGDRCLNIMPLFHIHGLIGAVLSSLSGGASIACSEGFMATKFFDWLRQFQPTWYTAVPTMHQAIVARAEAEGIESVVTTLRLVRSGSAALPPRVAEGIERIFGVPMIEGYGMTESANCLCFNPLPPREHRFGSVGMAAGPEIAIMNDRGELLGPEQTGEVVTRGPNITAGYENNPKANQEAFTNGWFRTGDLGRFDRDGYLFLAGRLKEIINRGGEKISPREIDEVLLDHPAIAQALTFAMPDPRLGEEIAAAVVLRKGAHVPEQDLMQFAAGRLADFKVPRRIVILDEIPKGPTGKPQRIGLAKKLGLDQPAAPVSASTVSRPLTPGEAALAAIWCDVLKRPVVRAEDNFLESGGDSILAAQIIARIRGQMGKELAMISFFGSPTLAAMAQAVEVAPTAAAVENSQMQDLLASIESMSEEEAQNLLKP